MNNFLIAILLFSVLQISGCTEQNKLSQNDDIVSDSIRLPDSEVSNAVIALYDREKVTTEILAEKLIRFESIDSTAIYEVEVDIFDSSGVLTTEVVGDSGVIRERKGYLELFGNVVVKTTGERTLEAEHLIWNSKSKLILSDLYVKFTHEKNIVTGIGLEATQDLTSIKILNNAEGEISTEEEKESPN